MKLADIFSNYFTVRAELREAVAPLSQEQLDWLPPDHPASIGRLLAHIADCEYFWIGVVATGSVDQPDWSRFEQARNKNDIEGLLAETFELTKGYLEEADFDDWDTVFYAHQQDDGTVEKFSKRWLAWHVVEHQARHRGQIFMLMRMQGAEVPNV